MRFQSQEFRLEDLRGVSSPFWLGLLALSMPWTHFVLGAWIIYPGQWAVASLAAVLALRSADWRGSLPALGPALLLCLWIALLTAGRGQWAASAAALGAAALHGSSGVAAHGLGRHSKSLPALREALLLLPGLGVLLGLLDWLLRALWPPACAVLNCGAEHYWPFSFTGALGNPDGWLLLLIVLLPVWVTPLLSGWRSRATPSRGLGVLTVLVVILVVVTSAGARWWALLLSAIGLGLLALVLRSRSRPGDALLVGSFAFLGALTLIVVYGLEPGFLARLGGSRDLAPVRLELLNRGLARLSSETTVPLEVRVANTGWHDMGSRSGAEPFQLVAQVALAPVRGRSRNLPLSARTPLPPLAPGAEATVIFPARLPGWVREGYLSLVVARPDGTILESGAGGRTGFRFLNEAHRPLAYDPENRLTALAVRARAWQVSTQAAATPGAAPESVVHVGGDVLDTLFFSPLWGQNPRWAEGPDALSSGRPFWLSLFHRFGLIGVLLGGWCALRLWRGCLRLASTPGAHREGGSELFWPLAAVSILLWTLLGLFSPAPGGWHAHWVLLLLMGFVGGRVAQLAPQTPPRPTQPSRMRGFRLHLSWPWPRRRRPRPPRPPSRPARRPPPRPVIRRR